MTIINLNQKDKQLLHDIYDFAKKNDKLKAFPHVFDEIHSFFLFSECVHRADVALPIFANIS